MAKKFQIAVVVGRFQPYHNFHHELVQQALELGENVLIVLGSHKVAPDERNPFSSDTREYMIRGCFDAKTNKRLSFRPVRDYIYDNSRWIAEIQNAVRNAQEELLEKDGVEFSETLHHSKILDKKVALVGHFKDDTSDYLKWFPQWEFQSFYKFQDKKDVFCATDIRKAMFEGERFDHFVPKHIAHELKSFISTQPFVSVQDNYKFNLNYKRNTKFVNAPFAATFITTDAVVSCMGHLLLVKRGTNPGKGLIALPGGFLAEGITLEDNAIKELKEETQIHVPPEKLRGCIEKYHVFDHPKRSLRGRIITHGYFIELPASLKEGLPLIKGGDDAAKAMWIPLADIPSLEDQFFEDHREIIRYFIGG